LKKNYIPKGTSLMEEKDLMDIGLCVSQILKTEKIRKETLGESGKLKISPPPHNRKNSEILYFRSWGAVLDRRDVELLEILHTHLIIIFPKFASHYEGLLFFRRFPKN
jgi:hypothetical protein